MVWATGLKQLEMEMEMEMGMGMGMGMVLKQRQIQMLTQLQRDWWQMQMVMVIVWAMGLRHPMLMEMQRSLGMGRQVKWRKEMGMRMGRVIGWPTMQTLIAIQRDWLRHQAGWRKRRETGWATGSLEEGLSTARMPMPTGIARGWKPLPMWRCWVMHLHSHSPMAIRTRLTLLAMT